MSSPSKLSTGIRVTEGGHTSQAYLAEAPRAPQPMGDEDEGRLSLPMGAKGAGADAIA
jgi:hypothetical protein